MKCKCNKQIPEGRVRLGFTVCVNCSSVQAYGCAPLINHKTGIKKYSKTIIWIKTLRNEERSSSPIYIPGNILFNNFVFFTLTNQSIVSHDTVL